MTDPIFAERRARALGAMGSGVLVIFSAPLAIRNNDVEHEYRQDSDFFYLTGFDEPEAVLVLSTVRPERFTLFVRPRDPEREVWDGARAGVDGATDQLGADQAFSITELEAKLPDFLENSERLYYRLGRQRNEDDVILGALERARVRGRKGSSFPVEIVDPATVVHEMRRIKGAEEVALLERAIEVTRDAHVGAMALARPGVFEYEVEALLRGVFRKHGSERPAYQPIVGSGENATVLHYRRNDRRMEAGDLLLIDAGAEYGYYAADVTRTFPVGGTFSQPQRRIYELVLAAQLASIEASRPGATLDDVHQASVKVLAAGLVDLGLIEGPIERVLSENLYRKYYMHKTSHYLGMDVHDVGRYFEKGAHRPLAPGVVITVEPGLYIPKSDSSVAAEYRGIGVRIEDDVLITDSGPRVLSSAIPKTVSEVEQACGA